MSESREKRVARVKDDERFSCSLIILASLSSGEIDIRIPFMIEETRFTYHR